jgi:hypothetical protein
MLRHRYSTIPGWFNFHRAYSAAVNAARRGAILIEIGAFKGRSTSYLITEAVNANKGISIHVVDTFRGTPGKHKDLDYWPIFDQNMAKPPDLRSYFTAHVMHSVDAADSFSDDTVAFLFIDGDHSYEAIKVDLDVWTTKVSGIIAGHDWKPNEFPGVCRAVNEAFPGRVQTCRRQHVWAVAIGDGDRIDNRTFLETFARR